MNKILVAFDGSTFSSGALEYALNLPFAQKSLIVGVFIEDLSYLGYATLFGEDYFAFDPKLLEQMEKESSAKIEEHIAAFTERCKSAGATCKVHRDKGVPAYELIHESRFADLIVLGFQTFFSSVAGEASTLKDVLTDAECPVIVAPQEYKPVKNVLLTFDGKSQSAFAIKQFIRLFPENTLQASSTLLQITDGKSEADDSDLMKEYLGAHYANLNYSNVSGDAEDAIMNFAEQQANPMVVMGAYSRTGVSRFFTLSTARKLLKEKSLPVFVAHK